MKTSELTGAALNYAVAKCEGNPISPQYWYAYTYADDWSQAGPIIKRERIGLDLWRTTGSWQAFDPGSIHVFSDRSPLTAAMRCYVASKLGDDVEIPEALK